MFEEELKKESGRIWTLFKPYFKDELLSDKEWDEIQKIATAENNKHLGAYPDNFSDPKVRTDPSYWKNAMDFYTVNYVLLILRMIEKKQKEIG